MVRKLKSLFVFLMASVLMLGFQNCSNHSYLNDQEVVNTNIGLLVDSDLSANEVSLYSFDQHTNEENIFSIKRLNRSAFQISDNKKKFLCDVNGENPFDNTLEILNATRVSYPSKILKDSLTCSSLDLPSQYIKIVSPDDNIYVVFKNNLADDCLSFNSDILLKSGKRVFITSGLSSEEINEMVISSQEMLDVLSCTEMDRQESMAALIK